MLLRFFELTEKTDDWVFYYSGVIVELFKPWVKIVEQFIGTLEEFSIKELLVIFSKNSDLIVHNFNTEVRKLIYGAV